MVEMATRYIINLSEEERLGLEDLLSLRPALAGILDNVIYLRDFSEGWRTPPECIPRRTRAVRRANSDEVSGC